MCIYEWRDLVIGKLLDVGFSDGCRVLVNYKGDIGKKGGKFKRQKQTNKVYLVSPKVYRDGLLTFNFFDWKYWRFGCMGGL